MANLNNLNNSNNNSKNNNYKTIMKIVNLIKANLQTQTIIHLDLLNKEKLDKVWQQTLVMDLQI